MREVGDARRFPSQDVVGGTMSKKILASIAMICALSAVSIALAQDEGDKKTHKHYTFKLQDNELRYGYGPYFRDPFITKPGDSTNTQSSNIAKNFLEFVHVDIGNTLGDNTFTMQYLRSNKTNPVSTPYFHNNTNVGAKDVYMTYRHDVVLSRIFKNANFSWGPIKDVIVSGGMDVGSKNDDFSNQRFSPMIGPGVQLKVPNGGYWKVVAMWTREWNEEGTDFTLYDSAIKYKPVAWGKPVLYAQEATLQTAWGLPFSLGRAPITFEGFGTLNSAKGYSAGSLMYNPTVSNGGSASLPQDSYYMVYLGTKPETIIHSMLMYNFGSLIGHGHNWQIGVGYEYWNNLFGVDHHKHPGCLENAPFLLVALHL
jgi:hypothetical protein